MAKGKQEEMGPKPLAGQAFYDVEQYEVGAWCPTPDGTGKPEQVHVCYYLRGVDTPFVLRLKSGDAIEQFIELLTRYAIEVWPERFQVYAATTPPDKAEAQTDQDLSVVLDGADIAMDLHQLVGYVWSHGNRRETTDPFPSDHMMRLCEAFLQKHVGTVQVDLAEPVEAHDVKIKT